MNLFPDEASLPPFIPGLELGEGFFRELVEPLLERHHPQLQYAAGLFGGGSEVLGFDTPMSMDHDWGPSVSLFLRAVDAESHGEMIRSLVREHLPPTYRDYPIRIWARGIRNPGERHRVQLGDPRLEPRVPVYTIRDFFRGLLGVDLDQELSAADWLTFTHQRLCVAVAGRVFRDDIGLQAVRDRFEWYPRDVWLYVLASCWARIGEDESLVGRAGTVGDELGAKAIAWRLIRDVIRLAFLMERSYPPYPKWFGSAFAQLRSAPVLQPLLEHIGAATGWEERDRALAVTYRELGAMHNALALTPSVPVEPRRFTDRPYTVSQAGRISGELRKQIVDPEVRRIADRWVIGNIDLVTDNHMVDDDLGLRLLLRKLYEA